MVKTYITKDYIAVNTSQDDHPKFKLTQKMWLTPEMEIQINILRKK